MLVLFTSPILIFPEKSGMIALPEVFIAVKAPAIDVKNPAGGPS